MKIFKWAEDIEKIYEDLIEKAKKENLEELQNFREEQDDILEEIMKKKEKVVNETLKSLSKEVDREVLLFQEKTSKSLQELVSYYRKAKDPIINRIIDDLGLNFYG